MSSKSVWFLLILLLICGVTKSQNSKTFIKTGVYFTSEDTTLMKLFELADRKAKDNIRNLTPNLRVMVEGAEYPFIWLETQPMAGVMYAKRDVSIAYNNVMTFAKYQRDDGRLPGMIFNTSNNIWKLNDPLSEDGLLGLHFSQLQGLYFAQPALELYYWLNNDKKYLNTIYKTLELYDNYLWKYRDSDNDGCLETWCFTDNGEDYLERLKYAPFDWISNSAPNLEKYANSHDKNDVGIMAVPEESMDVMGYSFACRDVLSKISVIMKNGKDIYWRNKANEVSLKMKDYLWIPEKHAYYYRGKDNKFINSLTHNNLRMMYFGTMSQSMADDFIHFHLLNPDEFWTPMPLPSVAANDSFFRNYSLNNWSGQPQGLTYQRAIRALENYGHYAEVGLIGKKLLNTISASKLFTQQFDPFTSVQNGKDGYGPTILSVLEYFSRMYGVNMNKDTIYFNGLPNSKSYSYTQKVGKIHYNISQDKSIIRGKLNGKEIFNCTAGVSILTDKNGKFLKLIGIDSISRNVTLSIQNKTYNIEVSPNSTYVVKDKHLVLDKRVPFNNPSL